MAAAKKISPNRRKSIAVPNQSRTSLVPKGRRRAHSIVPGTSLSPLAKARRSLAPRKSILKASINNLNIHSSSQANGQSQSSVPDDDAALRSMDMTQDHDPAAQVNASRKSLTRRVSWYKDTFVRTFQSKRKSSSGSSPSSPPSSDGSAVQQMSNENDYPGQASRRRRSSGRYSMASAEDMDLTSVAPSSFATRGSAILNEDSDYDTEDERDGETMDVTEAIKGNMARKHSLSEGRLSKIYPPHPISREGDESRSDIGNSTIQSEAVSEQSDQSQIMDFTVPLGQSLRPAQQDYAWLALKQMTHSGDDTSEPELSLSEYERDDMDLDDAMVRLSRARDSLALDRSIEAEQSEETQEDSFTSTEDSFEGDVVNENKTLNLSQVIGRVSLGPNSRISFGQNSNMDESEVYGDIMVSTPRQSLSVLPRPSGLEHEELHASQSTKASVFQLPVEVQQSLSNAATSASQQISESTGRIVLHNNSRPSSPYKPNSGSIVTSTSVKTRPSFTAAFAPPSARPSPKKAQSTSTDTRSPATKRPRSSHHDENLDTDKPSPAKRQALAGKWLDATEKASEDSPAMSGPKAPKSTSDGPRPLSPSKKAPFQASTIERSESNPRPSALRRPSGYFAKRKSMAVSFSASARTDENVSSPAIGDPSQKKKSAANFGRASLGSGPSDARTPLNNKEGGLEMTFRSQAQENVDEQETEVFVQEVARLKDAYSSSTKDLPSPKKSGASNPSNKGSEEPFQSAASSHRLDSIAEAAELVDASVHLEVDMEATRQWREGVQQDNVEEIPSISIAQFFSMTGIDFMDKLTAPRRSVHPSLQPFREPRNPADIPLAEYVTAMGIDVPQLDLYSRVSRDLEGWMAKSKIVLDQAEEEAAKVTPELFVEYVRADEEGRNELLHQLNLIRTHTRFLARSDWYDWKLQWVEGLRSTADEAFASLEADARALEEPKKSAVAIIPALEKEYEDLLRELGQERAEVAEIEGSDQDYLNELKATIAEQNIEIEALKAELTEGTDQNRWLQERMEEIDVQRREAKNTIATAQRILHMKQTSTRSEVFRLKGELEALEDLHMCRITKVNAGLFEYVHASLFHVSIPCENFVPLATKVSISRVSKRNTRYKDDFPRLSNFLMNAAQRLVTESENLTVRGIVHRLSDYWSSCAQLRSQLRLLSVKYPVEDVLLPPSKESQSPSFEAKSMVMFPAVQAKAFISFKFSIETFSHWPMSIDSLDCDVEVAYGSIDRTDILKAVSSRLSEATPSDNYACLLDACIEAQELYHQSS